MAAWGQEDQFPPPGLNVSYDIRKKNIVGMDGNVRDAPF